MTVIENNFFAEGLCLSLCESEDTPLLKIAEDICFPEDPWSAGMISDALGNSACRIYAVHDMQMTKIVAYGVMYLCLDEADLANIATLPEMRGQGLGGALLNKMLEKSSNDGVLRTFLEVRESNAPARGLYLSRGFKEIGKRKKYYRNPTEDAVIMVREEQ